MFPARPLIWALYLAFGAAGCASDALDLDAASSERADPAAPPDVAAPPAGAERSASGLVSQRLTAGQGDRFPRESDRVRVHYTGWQTNGRRFDSSIGGEPAVFRLSGVIAGWTEGLQLMVEGERRRLWIPEALAYRGGEPQGTLVFDVELIAILPP
jgi:peptidylprolyl isomerase